jgi:chorismate-pyruvate lyase
MIFECCRDGMIFDRSIGPVEVAALQQQLTTLSEHVKRLEAENSRRWHRELLLYPALVGYFLLQLARFVISNK